MLYRKRASLLTGKKNRFTTKTTSTAHIRKRIRRVMAVVSFIVIPARVNA